MLIIIDGYNLIRQSTTFSRLDRQDLQLGREALIEALAAYKRIKGHRIVVVFDGVDAPGNLARRDRSHGIEIRFSRHGELADTVIKRMVRSGPSEQLVVSSDRAIQQAAEGCGAVAIDARAFEDKLVLASSDGEMFGNDDDSQGWLPTTRKKGPSRKLSRKERRRRLKTRKL
jgi:predicted RNA-binding protein with PIN domain